MRQRFDIAAALAEAVLGEAEDPKKFFRQHIPRPDPKPPVEYELEDIGIDNCQYFQGRGLYGHHRDWDAVYVGVGDNRFEATDDALDQAGMDGWNVEGITAGDEPSQSVAAEYPDAEDLYYYVAVYLKGKRSRAESLLAQITEAEDPKKAFREMQRTRFPNNWPDEETLKWRNWVGNWGRKGRMARAIIKRRFGWGENAKEYDYHLPRTFLHHHNVDPKQERGATEPHFSVRYGNDHIVNYDRLNNLRVDHWNSGAARSRINRYLHSGWHLTPWRGQLYWWNDEWPENIRDRLNYDIRNRKDNKFPYWIPVRSSDYLMRNGDLVFNGGRGLAQPNGSLKLGTRDWPNLVKPSAGMMRPWHRARRTGYDPRQMQFQLESKYMRELDWMMRVRKKHAAMKDLAHRQKELENIDKPDKRKKRFNLH